MKNECAKVLVVLGFAITFFLSCTDNPTPDYPDIGYFLSSSSARPSKSSSSSSIPSSSSSVPSSSSIFSSSSIASSSSSKPSSSSSMPSSSSSSAVPSSSSYLWSDDSSIGQGNIIKGTFYDKRDTLPYKWVRIGSQNSQIWMAENLNYYATSSICYNNSPQNCEIYGRLYDWNEAVSDACPKGWKLPSIDEWNLLGSYAGGSSGINLRSTEGWTTNAISPGTDLYSFNALPGGFYDNTNNTYYGGANFEEQGSYWWISSTNTGHQEAPHMAIFYNKTELSSGYSDKNSLLSVRCIRR